MPVSSFSSSPAPFGVPIETVPSNTKSTGLVASAALVAVLVVLDASSGTSVRGALKTVISTRFLGTVLLVGLVLSVIYIVFCRQFTSSVRNLPGPEKADWFWGNMKEQLETAPGELQFDRGEKYGHTHRHYGALGAVHVSTSDTRAVAWIFNHPDKFIKTKGSNQILVDALGHGLVSVDGPRHRRYRRVLNPAFGWVQVQGMAGMVFDKARQLRTRLQDMIDNEPNPLPDNHPDNVPGSCKIDVLKHLSAATLDIIAVAGFGYDIQAIDDKPNEMREAYTDTIAAAFNLNWIAMLQFEFPQFHVLPTARKIAMTSSRNKAQVIGRRIVAEKKKLVEDMYDGKVQKSTDMGKDVLSLLIKSNMAPDLREDQKMTDEELMEQISTLLFAGHETTGTAMNWCLYRLALNPDIQQRLREELATIDEDEPSFDTLDSLKYLDNVVHESLRLETPIPLTVRIAQEDCVVPLGKPVMGRDGTMIDSLVLTKGTKINIPMSYMNMRTDIWGPDATEFNPDRWNKQHQQVPGVWGNIMTFISGPRNCIGHRLTLVEMKILLFILLRSFEFAIPPSKPQVKREWLIIQRPGVIGEEEKGPYMPLMIRAL